MGFAASQARFLSLTARLSDSEYEAQQISQERVDLNNQMALYADEYDAATNNQYIAASVFENGGTNQANVVLSYDVITKAMLDGGLGMKLVTASGLMVVPSEEEMFRQINESEDTDNPLTIADFYVFEDVNDTSILQKNLEEGNFYLTGGKNENGEWNKKSIESLNNLTYAYDKADDDAAKAKYDKRMTKAEAKDSMLEMRLNQVEADHKAIETEMEAVQKVIDNNIENNFKIFG